MILWSLQPRVQLPALQPKLSILIDLGAGTDTISTGDATINATDKTWVGYIKNSEAIKVTATAEKTVDLDLLANTNIVALSSSAHTATAAAADVDAGGTGRYWSRFGGVVTP